MDFTNDKFIKMYYDNYVWICDNYQDGTINNDEAVAELKTLHEAIGIYVCGVFEIERRKKGGE